MAIDPVCKMEVDQKQVAAKAEYQGATYYFCSSACHKTFTAEPAKYAKPGGHGQPHGGGHKR